MTSIMIFSVLAAILLQFSAVCSGQRSTGGSKQMTDGILVSWATVVDDAKTLAGTVTFTVNTNKTGWIGLGIPKDTNNPNMVGSDMWIGGVDATNSYYLWDLHGDPGRNTRPIMDENQSLTKIAGARIPGNSATFSFSRPLKTGDKDDLDIPVGPINMIFAYHVDEPKDLASATYHGDSSRGSQQVILIESGATSIRLNSFSSGVLMLMTTALMMLYNRSF